VQTAKIANGHIDALLHLRVAGDIGFDESHGVAERVAFALPVPSLTSTITARPPAATIMSTVAPPRPEAPPVTSTVLP
jgi:hypothetical protein